jgi:ABC-2 type transport system permease protein
MLALLVANLKIMLRDRQALLWALLFPLILVTVFGLFDVDRAGSADLAIIDRANTDSSRELHNKLDSIEYLNVHIHYASEAVAHEALGNGDLEYLLVIPESFAMLPGRPGQSSQDGGNGAAYPDAPVSLDLYYDGNNSRGSQLVIETIRHFVDEETFRLTGRPQLLEVLPRKIQAVRIEYFDVLLIGLVGMGVMTNSLIFIAVKISTYRNQAVLKRILVTPLRVRNYFASEIVAHLLLTLVQAAVVIGAGVFIFGATIHGNLLWLFIILAFANTIFLNLGFIISGWANSPRAASGMGNAVAIPMLFFSGTFFPTSTLPAFLPDLVQALPLTPMLDAMRGVTIDGLGLPDVWRELAMLAGWLVVSSVAAIKLFKFG